MLSRDYGRSLRHELESSSEPQKVDRYSESVREYARVQTATLSHVAELLELGCPDRRLNVIAQEYSALIDYAETVNQLESNLISPLGFTHLRDRAGYVESRCEQLDKIGIPPALEHGDLHSNQIAMRDGRFVFADWSDCSISHSFFSLPPALYHDRLVFGDREAARSSAVRAYLEMWSQFASQDELRRAYDLAEPLAFIHRAMLNQRLVSLVDDGSDSPELQVVGYLSEALKRMR
jgi:Asp-tRNA(Asn)/Glu-tRNA(Gln) amidotransferase C subunit